jgi:hypothetical protein
MVEAFGPGKTSRWMCSRHVDKCRKVIVTPLVGPIDGLTEQTSPEMICEQRQTVVARTGQLMAVAGMW